VILFTRKELCIVSFFLLELKVFYWSQ